MTSLREMAADPRKALKDLEKRLGVAPGSLLRDMENLAPPGEEWGRHLSYKAAVSYNEDDQTRLLNEAHVDRCDYCKSLLDSLHPTSLDASTFAQEAGRLYSNSKPPLHVKVAPYALAASVILCAVGAWAYITAQVRASNGIPVFASNGLVSSERADTVVAVNGPPQLISAGQPVTLVAEIRDASDDTPVSVVWRDPDDKQLSVSTSWVRKGERELSFTAENTSGWKTGRYHAEVWVANEKVLQEPFGVEAQQ
jgi:hypothetical protein